MAIQVLDRAMRILRVVARAGTVTLSEVSREVRIPVPSVARILASLEENGVVQRDAERRYSVGVRVLTLGRRLDGFREALGLVRPALESLSRTTGEDAGFAVLQGSEAVVVDWAFGSQSPRIIEPFSREIPLHCAFGMTLVAFQPAARRRRFLEGGDFRRLASGTATDSQRLADRIEAIRRTRVYHSSADNVEGAGSVSVPVFDQVSRLLGSLFITAPLDRLQARSPLADANLLLSKAEEIRQGLRDASQGRGGRAGLRQSQPR